MKKPPLINRGYYTRHQCVSTLLGDFKRRCDDAGLGCQVLNLGAGFDTTFWHLKSQARPHARTARHCRDARCHAGGLCRLCVAGHRRSIESA